MTEQESNRFEVDEAAISKFREVLEQLNAPGSQDFRDLLGRGLIRLTTNQNAVRAIRKNQKSGVVGFSVCLDPKTRSAKTLVAIDSDKLMFKGPFSTRDSVRDMLIKFEACSQVVEKANLSWQYLEDSEVGTFIKEIDSRGGKDYSVLDLG